MKMQVALIDRKGKGRILVPRSLVMPGEDLKIAEHTVEAALPMSLYTWDDNGNINLDEKRHTEFLNNRRKAELKRILTAYTEDFAQAAAGAYISDLAERKAQFLEAHAELRRLEGKEPR